MPKCHDDTRERGHSVSGGAFWWGTAEHTLATPQKTTFLKTIESTFKDSGPAFAYLGFGMALIVLVGTLGEEFFRKAADLWNEHSARIAAAKARQTADRKARGESTDEAPPADETTAASGEEGTIVAADGAQVAA